MVGDQKSSNELIESPLFEKKDPFRFRLTRLHQRMRRLAVQ